MAPSDQCSHTLTMRTHSLLEPLPFHLGPIIPCLKLPHHFEVQNCGSVSKTKRHVCTVSLPSPPEGKGSSTGEMRSRKHQVDHKGGQQGGCIRVTELWLPVAPSSFSSALVKNCYEGPRVLLGFFLSDFIQPGLLPGAGYGVKNVDLEPPWLALISSFVM